METVTDFIFWGSEIIIGCDCSHEFKTRLLLGQKAMTNLNSVLKSIYMHPTLEHKHIKQILTDLKEETK